MEITLLNVMVALICVLIVVAFFWWKFRKEIQFLFKQTKVDGTITNWLATMQDGKRVYYPMIDEVKSVISLTGFTTLIVRVETDSQSPLRAVSVTV